MNHRTAVAWSMGSKHKYGPFDSKIETPGPGNYSDESYKKIRPLTASYSFGKDSKNKNISSFTPGPGYYKKADESLFGKHTPKYTMGKSEKIKNMNLTMTIKPSEGFINSKMLDTPGPGNYEINSETLNISKKKSPSYKIPLSPRLLNKDKNIPGPGEYNANSKAIKFSSPKWSLNKSLREDLFTNRKDEEILPGPGAYSLTPKIGQGPKVN